MDAQPKTRGRKRKAENQDNDIRLSKRLSLLNLERNGQKLYVPVEHPTEASSSSIPKTNNRTQQDGDDTMRLDDTKHKVYIYDLDAELSDSESSDDGKLVFLPDIQKHLLESRIPPSILANSDGQLAGQDIESMQMVLYSVPSSLTVPEEQDSVRRAILETRARARKRAAERSDKREPGDGGTSQDNGINGMSVGSGVWGSGAVNGNAGVALVTEELMDDESAAQELEDDPDAMDLG